MAAVTICSDLGAPPNKVCHCFHCFPIYLPGSDGDRMPWSLFFECWVLQQAFPLSSLTFIKRLFSSSPFSATRVVSLAYLRLLLFLLVGNLDFGLWFIQPSISHDVFWLFNQGDKIQPWCTPFPILNQSIVPCLVLTVASWPAYRFLRRQVNWSATPISDDRESDCNAENMNSGPWVRKIPWRRGMASHFSFLARRNP